MKPESVGLSTSRLATLDKAMTSRYVETGRLPGIITMVYRRGHLVHTGISGQMDIERRKPMREDAIFRIYSMTKPVTAVALTMLVEEGLIGLDEDVATYIPSWKNLGVYATGAPSLIPTATRSFITTPAARPVKVIDLLAPPGLFSESGYAGIGFSLGCGVNINVARTRLPGTVGEYFWGGAASTAFWIDPNEELAVVFMTQVLGSDVRLTLRRDLRTLVYSAFTESFAA
jgi:CubicO group peptidase (beta-lactamase class C family)